jgi:hypothetical protein
MTGRYRDSIISYEETYGYNVGNKYEVPREGRPTIRISTLGGALHYTWKGSKTYIVLLKSIT